MTLALLQPVPAPDLYDLAAILQSDQVILQDLDTWSRKGRMHRMRIRTPDGSAYLSFPVRSEDRKKPIGSVRIDQSIDWFTPMMRSLEYNYSNSLYFGHYGPEVEADLRQIRREERLLPAMLHLRKRLYRYLEIDRELEGKERLASGLPYFDEDPDRLAVLLGATRLYQEHGSRHYMRQAKMRSEPATDHPVYYQHFDGFIPGCALYDLLFQCGPESFRILDALRITDHRGGAAE